MKLNHKLLILFLGLAPFSAHAAEYSKKVHQGFEKSLISAMSVTNKFGTVELNDWGGDSVTIDVTITVQNNSENRAIDLLDLIEIEIIKSGGLIKAETLITDKFKTTQNFSIDYKINIPKDRNITINNRFGNIVLNELEGKGIFEIAYGNFTSGEISSVNSTQLNLSYGKADIESINKLKAEIKYSKLFIGNASGIEISSKYSGLNIEEINDLQLDSKYDDISIEEATTISSNSKYTNYNIEELKKSLILDTQYGSVRIDEVNPNFSNIEITNSYGGINIGLNDNSYHLDAECDFCDIEYPSAKFEGNQIKDNNNTHISGVVGKNNGEKRVLLKSRFGSIKLLE